MKTRNRAAWAWDEGGRLAPWTQRKALPYPALPPENMVTWAQFAIFPTRRDCRTWAKSMKLREGKPRRVAVQFSK